MFGTNVSPHTTGTESRGREEIRRIRWKQTNNIVGCATVTEAEVLFQKLVMLLLPEDGAKTE